MCAGSSGAAPASGRLAARPWVEGCSATRAAAEVVGPWAAGPPCSGPSPSVGPGPSCPARPARAGWGSTGSGRAPPVARPACSSDPTRAIETSGSVPAGRSSRATSTARVGVSSPARSRSAGSVRSARAIATPSTSAASTTAGAPPAGPAGPSRQARSRLSTRDWPRRLRSIPSRPARATVFSACAMVPGRCASQATSASAIAGSGSCCGQSPASCQAHARAMSPAASRCSASTTAACSLA